MLRSLNNLQGSLPQRPAMHRLARAQMLSAMLLRMRCPVRPGLAPAVKVSRLLVLPGSGRHTTGVQCRLAWSCG